MSMVPVMLLLLQGQRPLSVTREMAALASPPSAGFTDYFSRDGKTLLTAAPDGTLQIWKVSGGRASFTDEFRVHVDGDSQYADSFGYALSPDAGRLAIWSWLGRVEVWDLRSLKRIFADGSGGPSARQVQFYSRRPWLFYMKGDHKYRVDIVTGQYRPTAISVPFAEVAGTTEVATLDGLYDAVTNRKKRSWKSKVENVLPVTVSPNGKYAVIGGENPDWSPPPYAASEAAYARTQSLRTWRISDGKLVRTMPGFSGLYGDGYGIYWKSGLDLAIPGLAVERNVLSGRAVRRLEDPQFRRLPSNVTADPDGNLLRLSSGPAQVPVSKVAFASPGSLAILHPRMPVSASQSILGLLDGSSKVRILVRSIVPSPGGLGFDSKGAFIPGGFYVEAAGDLTLLETVRRFAPRNSQMMQVTRYVFQAGLKPEVSHLEVTEPAPLSTLLGGVFPGRREQGQAWFDGRHAYLYNYRKASELICVDLGNGATLWRKDLVATRFEATSLSVGRGRVAIATEDNVSRQSSLLLINADDGRVIGSAPTHALYQTRLSDDGTKLAAIGHGDLGWFDLTRPDLAFHPLTGSTNCDSGHIDDGSLVWNRSGSRLLVVNSLNAIEIYDGLTGSLLGRLALFADDSWLLSSVDGRAAGTSARMGLAKAWTGRAWKAANPDPNLRKELLD